jgi:hypothetical protein
VILVTLRYAILGVPISDTKSQKETGSVVTVNKISLYSAAAQKRIKTMNFTELLSFLRI